MKLYLDGYIGREPEIPSRIRAPLTCTRQPACSTCVAINRFLQSPTVMLCLPKEIRIPKEAYDHARKCLKQLEKHDCVVKKVAGTDFSYVSLEKTWRPFNKRYRNLEDRVEVAKNELRSIDLDVLKQVLGDAFDDIVKMRRIRLPPEGTLPVTQIPQPVSIEQKATVKPRTSSTQTASTSAAKATDKQPSATIPAEG
ncbi:hypothetical protein CC86DRAFT_157572 [Ophiobolus disseminans]|uniref:Uncharacterized protein n=1 Tax=Ophiobolus disseminans TaxID=1469910 RepID=A0A6A6ZBH2_9PLEO|nr:hypothetical protein CC86DRAFT_157572 [Ophiobolus disseminans]